MKKIGKWLLLVLKCLSIFLYGFSPLVSICLFFGVGVFGYGYAISSPSFLPTDIPLLIFYSCGIPWMFFALGIFVSKVLKAKVYSNAIQIATISPIIVVSILVSYFYCVVLDNGYIWIVYDLLPLLFWFFLPHVTYLVWHLTRPKKLPWIFTLLGYSAVAVTLHVIAHINLDNVLRFGHS